MLVLSLLIFNDASAQSYQYDTRGRLTLNNTIYGPKNRIIKSLGKLYWLPQIRSHEYVFGDIVYNMKSIKIKTIISSSLQPYMDLHQYPIKISRGVYYLYAREYMPSIKRFMQMDSWNVSNYYNYAKGNPVKYTDLNGHFPKILEWIIPQSPVEAISLGISILLGGIGDWYLAAKLLSIDKKVIRMTVSGTFNGLINAGGGYLGSGLDSGDWHDFKRIPIDFGLGFIEGLIVGNIADKNAIKRKTKKDIIKNDIRLNVRKLKIKEIQQNNPLKRFKTSDILLGEVRERYKATNVSKTLVIKDRTSYLFESNKNITSIDLDGIQHLTESKFKDGLITSQDLNNDKFALNYK